MLKNAPTLAIGGFHTAENEHPKVRESTEKAFLQNTAGRRDSPHRLRKAAHLRGVALWEALRLGRRQHDRLSPERAHARGERYGSRATVSFESLHIRIPLKFCQN